MKEPGVPVTTEQMMQLMRRADVPPHFSGYNIYDTTAHREKPAKGSLYLKNNSVTINCYDKHYQLDKKYHDCPDISRAENVIRFEVQFKYRKVYNFSKSFGGHMLSTLLNEMFYDEVCINVISVYSDKTIMRGDYYTLELARHMIEVQHFHANKERWLIKCLELVNGCRGIAKAKQSLQGEELEVFKRSLKDLASVGVNPVTIPREWGVKHIRNLFDAYSDKVAVERGKAEREQLFRELCEDSLSKKAKRKRKPYQMPVDF